MTEAKRRQVAYTAVVILATICAAALHAAHPTTLNTVTLAVVAFGAVVTVVSGALRGWRK